MSLSGEASEAEASVVEETPSVWVSVQHQEKKNKKQGASVCDADALYRPPVHSGASPMQT